MMVLSTSASSGLTSRSRSASVLDGAICSSGTSSPVAGSRYWTRLWWVSSVSSSMRMPVARRTSTVAQVQNARSSSWMRSRRLPAPCSPAQILAVTRVVARTGEGLPAGGEGLARDCAAGRCQARGGVLAPLVGGADQDRQHGQAFAGAGVIRDLRCRLCLRRLDLLGADRAGHGPGTPAGRVFDRPVSEVQVERADRGQAFAVVDPGDGAGHFLTGRRPARLGYRLQALFPVGRGFGAQLEGGDAGVMLLDIGPEQLAERRPRAIPGWCSPVRADVLAGSPPAGRGPGGRRSGKGRSAPPACAGRRCRARAVSRVLARRSCPARGACGRAPRFPVLRRRRSIGVQQLQHVTGGDVGQDAALGRGDHRSPVDGQAADHPETPESLSQRTREAARTRQDHGTAPWPRRTRRAKPRH